MIKCISIHIPTHLIIYYEFGEYGTLLKKYTHFTSKSQIMLILFQFFPVFPEEKNGGFLNSGGL